MKNTNHSWRARRCVAALLVLLATATWSACGEDDTDPQDTVSEPEAVEPETQEPEAGEPEVTEPDAGEPEVGEPEVMEPEVTPEPGIDPLEGPYADLFVRGDYEVGYQSTEITYTPDGFEERTLRTVFWYPTDETEGDTPLYAGLLPRPGVLEGAEVALEESAPVVVFSHGNSGLAEQSYFLTEFLATHGFIVVAFDHTGNTFNDDGEASTFFDIRPQDVSAVLDAVENLPEADQLAGLFSDQIVMSGHSFGGYTTLAVAGASYGGLDAGLELCELLGESLCNTITMGEERFRAGYGDDRIDVAIPLTPAGAMFFEEGLEDIEIPLMLMTAARDATLPESQEGDPIWNDLDGDVRVVIENGGHFTYSDACSLAAGVGEDDGCGDDFLPSDEAHPVINAYFLAFVRKHLFGEDRYDGLLDGTDAVHTEFTVFTK